MKFTIRHRAQIVFMYTHTTMLLADRPLFLHSAQRYYLHNIVSTSIINTQGVYGLCER
jgi:hypothetical protein